MTEERGMKARVAWRIRGTGTSGFGNPLPYDEVVEAVKLLNMVTPTVYHWVERVWDTAEKTP